MSIITVRGELHNLFVQSGDNIYTLCKNCKANTVRTGWIQLLQQGDKWKLLRLIEESKVEVYHSQ